MVDVFRVSYTTTNLSAIGGEDGHRIESGATKTDFVPNSYVVLGLADDADMDEIQARFIQLSAENQKASAFRSEEDLKRRQQIINQAHDVLKHPAKKAALDKEIASKNVVNVKMSSLPEEILARINKLEEYKSKIARISNESDLPDAVDVLCLEIGDVKERELLYLIKVKRGEFIFNQIERAKNLDDLPVVNLLRKLYKEKKLTTMDLTSDDGLISRIRNKAHGFMEAEIKDIKDISEVPQMRLKVRELYDNGQINSSERDEFLNELDRIK